MLPCWWLCSPAPVDWSMDDPLGCHTPKTSRVPAKQSMLLPVQVLYHAAFFVYQRSLVTRTTVLAEKWPWYQTIKLTKAIWTSTASREVKYVHGMLDVRVKSPQPIKQWTLIRVVIGNRDTSNKACNRRIQKINTADRLGEQMTMEKQCLDTSVKDLNFLPK